VAPAAVHEIFEVRRAVAIAYRPFLLIFRRARADAWLNGVSETHALSRTPVHNLYAPVAVSLDNCNPVAHVEQRVFCGRLAAFPASLGTIMIPESGENSIHH
jgi:hypothetical protein